MTHRRTLAVCAFLSLALLGPIAGAQEAPPAFLVGKWVVSSVATGDRLTDITLAEDGKVPRGSLGARLRWAQRPGCHALQVRRGHPLVFLSARQQEARHHA
jgi:hypothetical protein